MSYSNVDVMISKLVMFCVDDLCWLYSGQGVELL